MSAPRFKAGAAHHHVLGFLVSGGAPGLQRTTEVTKDGITFEAFTPLPIGVQAPCAVALGGDDGDFFVGGGYDGSPHSKRAFIHRGNQWVEMQEMPTARHSKHCMVARWLWPNFVIEGFWPFGLEGLWLRYATLQNLVPSFPWIALPSPNPDAIQGKEWIKFCHLPTLARSPLQKSRMR